MVVSMARVTWRSLMPTVLMAPPMLVLSREVTTAKAAPEAMSWLPLSAGPQPISVETASAVQAKRFIVFSSFFEGEGRIERATRKRVVEEVDQWIRCGLAGTRAAAERQIDHAQIGQVAHVDREGERRPAYARADPVHQ